MIHIENPISLPQVLDEGVLEKAALATLEHQSADLDSDLTLVLADDAQLHTLNRDFLEIDAPTDVLSFPASETDPETGAHYIGDILVSVERAALQAEKAGHALMDELQLLVVHGVLHLLGHDHAEAGEKAQMWAAQAQVLERLGLGHITVSEE
jgi:probable rRNA maturation factor